MIASIFVLIVSTALFVYWFRYSCLLILSARTARDHTKDVAVANGLAFLDARDRLAAAEPDNSLLNDVHKALDQDFRLVTYLLRHAGPREPGALSLEHLVLRIDYRMMCLWYRAIRPLSGSMARSALLEMTSVIGYLANAMGERSSVSARA